MEYRSETQPEPLRPSPQLPNPSVTSSEKNHTGNTAHVNNLPTELLVQIFLLSLVLGYETVANDLLFEMDALNQLRSVCTRWNDTILGEPAFWTHIDIEAGPRTVELKLLRSGSLPLTIRYYNVEEEASEEEEHPEFLRSIGLIGRHTFRWKSISFSALDWELDQLTDYLERSPHPDMEYLKILRSSVSGDLVTWVCGDASSLRRVIFDGRALPRNSSEFSSLVNLEIEGAVGRLDLLVALIQASQSLEAVRFIDIEFDDDAVEVQRSLGWPDESRSSVLPKLKNIQIFGLESPVAIACVMRCIRAPNITVLWVAEGRVVEGLSMHESLFISTLTTYHGSQSILASMLHNISSLASVQLSCSEDTMCLDLEDSGTAKRCRLELSLIRADWIPSAAVVGEAVRIANVPICLQFERVDFSAVAAVISIFNTAVELEFASSDIPIQDVLLILRTLSNPIDIPGDGKTWICPQLARVRLPGGWPEAEAAVIAKSATLLKRARRDFNDQKTGEDDSGDSCDVRHEVGVLVGGSEI
ncbi:hypothetical protein FRC04_003251 [Tulasnella sp. 424]|nr:hypothetical protein FRC04_003251 [Tulasnella sp. 424]KAG8965955.1 hypothetical protein FRC05_002946 [Tulasnella sp. 425]